MIVISHYTSHYVLITNHSRKQPSLIILTVCSIAAYDTFSIFVSMTICLLAFSVEMVTYSPTPTLQSASTQLPIFIFFKSLPLPIYLAPHFRYLCSSHNRNLRSVNDLLISCPSHNSNFTSCSFFVQAVYYFRMRSPSNS